MFTKDDWGGVLVLKESIKHFESLQKRYTTQHNGKQCEYVKTALEAMRKEYEIQNASLYKEIIGYVGEYSDCWLFENEEASYSEKVPAVLDELLGVFTKNGERYKITIQRLD